MNVRFSKIFVLTLCIVTYAGFANAATLDQNTIPSAQIPEAILYVSTSLDPSFRRAQTFTVGIDGQLDSIAVKFNGGILNSDPAIWASEMRVLSVTNGVPGSILASTTSWSLNGQIGTFDLSTSGLSFATGTQLAFEVVGGGAVQALQNGDTSVPSPDYLGGSDFIFYPRLGNTQWTDTRIFDAEFQTYMNPVPLPGAAFLLFSGLCSIGSLARITRKRVVTAI